jgi:hypothetical protein
MLIGRNPFSANKRFSAGSRLPDNGKKAEVLRFVVWQYTPFELQITQLSYTVSGEA